MNGKAQPDHLHQGLELNQVFAQSVEGGEEQHRDRADANADQAVAGGVIDEHGERSRLEVWRQPAHAS